MVKADVQSKDLIKEVERGLGGKAIKLAEELHERGKKIFGLISWNIPARSNIRCWRDSV